MIELLIRNGNTMYQPVLEGDIKWETQRKGVPGKLTFTVLPDDIINFQEGNHVTFKVGDAKIFYGFVFKKERSKDKLIKVIAYDQLRYLKNKDTYIYYNKTASEVVGMIANDYMLNVGDVTDTEYKIETRIEDNKTLFDIILNALDLTVEAKKKLYVLYDNFGKLTLKDVESMRLSLLIDEETAEDYNYSSSIDGETYNKIKLSYENKETGKREIYMAQDATHINNWGILQYYEKIDEVVNGKAKADALLKLYNAKERNLNIKNAFGDVKVRAGSSIPVNLNLGDIIAKNYLIVEKVIHTFSNDQHMMDLTLRGGLINA